MFRLPFHTYKDPDPTHFNLGQLRRHFVEHGAFAYAVVRTRSGQAQNFFHVIFLLRCRWWPGLYGIFQYDGKDMIWGSPIQPYGGRPVSTFGNPNFLSSYSLLVCPLAVAFALNARPSQRVGYVFVALVAMGVGAVARSRALRMSASRWHSS